MGRLRGCIWLTAGLLVALLAGVVGYTTLLNATSQRTGQAPAVPLVPVVIAVRAVPVRAVLTAADVQLKSIPVDLAPVGALPAVADAVGKVTLVELFQGETILAPRLLNPNVVSPDGKTGLVLAADHVLMDFPAADLMSTSGILRPGDHVDLLFSLDFSVAGTATASTAGGAEGKVAAGTQKARTTFNGLQNGVISALVAGATTPGGTTDLRSRGILLAVSPQDALVLKYIKDSGGVLDVVVRAPGADQPFAAEPVDEYYIANRYRIP